MYLAQMLLSPFSNLFFKIVGNLDGTKLWKWSSENTWTILSKVYSFHKEKKNFHVEKKLSLYHKDVQQLHVSKTNYPTEWTKDEERRAQLLARGWEGGFRNFRGVEEQTSKGRGCIYNVFGKVTVSRWLAVQSGLGGSAI